MKSRLRDLLSFFGGRLTSSLWFIPALFTLGAAVLAVTTVSLDRRTSLDGASSWILFGAGADGARGVLSTIAGSIITVTGVVFSITIVALQLASSQYTPRVLRSFTEDRATQIVLGIFIGTFTYSLLVLRVIRSEFDDFDRFVPAVSVTLAVGMALASIAALIFFVNHIARSIRVENVMERISADVVRRIDELYPDDIGTPAGATIGEGADDPLDRAVGSVSLRAKTSGYLQELDEDALLELGDDRDVRIEMQVQIGDFLVEGDAIASVSPPAAAAEAEDRIGSLFRIGAERTLRQDLGRGIMELTDVALRALSPGVNDPTTALGAIDRLTQILILVAKRRFPDPVRSGRGGKVRFVGLPPSFDELVHLPFSQLRHSGAEVPIVAERIILSLQRIGAAAAGDRRAAPVRELEEVMEAIRLSVDHPADLARLEEVGQISRAELDRATAEETA